jgi:hypothetical protein
MQPGVRDFKKQKWKPPHLRSFWHIVYGRAKRRLRLSAGQGCREASLLIRHNSR